MTDHDAKHIQLFMCCISTVGWHDLPSKTLRRPRTQQLDFSLAHSLDPQHDESGLVISQHVDTIAFYSMWIN